MHIAKTTPLIEVSKLSLYYDPTTPFIHNLSLKIMNGEKIALVGPSGAGKSSLARVLAGITPLVSPLTLRTRRILVRQNGWVAGGILNYTPLNRRQNNSAASRALIFQDARATLNPLMPVVRQLRETILRDSTLTTTEDVNSRLKELWSAVGLNRAQMSNKLYPHQFSGGMCQRAVIAIALATRPALIIADEPTKSLDSRVETQIVDILQRLSDQRHNALVFITHDILLAHKICDHILVMDKGTILDQYQAAEYRNQRRHTTTEALWQAATQLIPRALPLSLSNKRPALLRLEKLSYTHQRHPRTLDASAYLLRNINLTIHRNQCVGLQGPSGSGKSTLLELVAQLRTPDSGHLRFQGKKIGAMPRKARRALRRTIQIIFQDPLSSMNLYQRTGDIISEPLRIIASNHPTTNQDIMRAVHQVLRDVGLSEHHIQRYPHQLSGGEQQRVLIARALILRPSLVLADEPLSTLDTINQYKIVTLFNNLRERLGISFFIVSHHIELLQNICDQVYLLHRGRLKAMPR